ncbi:MAG: HEPN domain-containing protein [bacterium]|nr:HEPN domain-containing protein [bacterium]
MEPKIELAKYRLEDAKEKLCSAEMLLNSNSFKDSVSRSYYAMFSAARALLAMKCLDSSKHSGVISLFNLHLLKTGAVGKKCGGTLAKAKTVREKSDMDRDKPCPYNTGNNIM